jgi:hypothetical protein
MTGAGQVPAGSSIAGYGIVATTATPLNVILPDPSTGLPQTGRLLVPNAANNGRGDWAFTADGRVVGCGTVRQLVQLALTTAFRSSASPTLGIALDQVKEQSANFQRQVATVVANALAPLVSQGLVQLLTVSLQQTPSNPDAGVALVTWRDLTTGQVNQTTIGP